VAANVAPNTAGGLAAGVALNKGSWWSIGIESRGYFPNSTDERGGASAAVSSFMVGAMPCARTSTQLPIPVFGCLVAAVGALHTEGTGVDVPQEDSDVYVGLGGRVGFEVPLMSRLALRVHGEVAYVPVTWDVRLAGEVVWDTPPVMVGAGGGFVTFF
jgi:ABC-type amino acid transport substrate-binding protein